MIIELEAAFSVSNEEELEMTLWTWTLGNEYGQSQSYHHVYGNSLTPNVIKLKSGVYCKKKSLIISAWFYPKWQFIMDIVGINDKAKSIIPHKSDEIPWQNIGCIILSYIFLHFKHFIVYN